MAVSLGGAQSMAGHRREDGLEIIGQDQAAAVDPRPGTGCRQEGQPRPGAEAVTPGTIPAGRLDQDLKVVDEGRRHMDRGHNILEGDKFCRGHQRQQTIRRLPSAPGSQQSFFGRPIGIAQFEAHEEAVELRLGQGKGTDLVGRILGGDDEKGRGKAAGFALGGDLAFLHGFEKGALGLGGSPVDFVSQNELAENRTGKEAESSAVPIEERDAGNIRREKIAGELDAGKLEPQEPGEGVGEGGFPHAGDVFDQQVAPGKQAGQGKPDLPLFAQDDLGGSGEDRRDGGRRWIRGEG